MTLGKETWSCDAGKEEVMMSVVGGGRGVGGGGGTSVDDDIHGVSATWG